MSQRVLFSLISAAIVVAFFVLDQFLKAVAFLQFITWFSFFNGSIQSVRHQNFGLLANVPAPRVMIVILTCLILVGLMVLLTRSLKRQETASFIFLSILLAGALGNLSDRIIFGYVRDWILLFDRSAINLADAYVAIGGIGYVIVLARQKEKMPV